MFNNEKILPESVAYLKMQLSARKLPVADDHNLDGFEILFNSTIKSAKGLAIQMIDGWYGNIREKDDSYYNDYSIKDEECTDGGWMSMSGLRGKTYLNYVYGRDFKLIDDDSVYLSILWGMDERNRMHRYILMQGYDTIKLFILIEKMLDFLDSEEDMRLVSKENKINKTKISDFYCKFR